jgi:transposase-like protein
MKELSVAEQRYQAVLSVISDGLSISLVAEKVGVSRQTLHSWLARYEAEGLEGLADRSHRPVSCPHQMPAAVEAELLELRRSRPYRGPWRLVFELSGLQRPGDRLSVTQRLATPPTGACEMRRRCTRLVR